MRRNATPLPRRFRVTELALIVLTGIALACGYAILGDRPIAFAFFSIAPFLVCWAIMCAVAPGANQIIIPLASLVTGLGLINQLQISFDGFAHQLTMSTAGAAAFVGALLLLRYRPDVTRYKYVLGALALVLFFLPAAVGVTRGGARLWVAVGPAVVQPSEIARVFLFLFLARYFSEHQAILVRAHGLRRRSVEMRYLGPAVLVAMLTLVLLVYVKDLGFSLLLLATFLVSLYAATGKKRYPAGGLVAFTLGVAVAYRLYEHVRVRIDVWLHPWEDVYGRAYQIAQGLFAYAEGGLIGRGLGHGFPALLPAVSTDMVLPLFAETAGFVGVAVVMSAYLAFLLVSLAESRRLSDSFAALLIVTAASSMFIQAALVAAGTLRLLPLTGLTMPFFSYGGSSLVSSFVVLALILDATSERRTWIVP